MIQIGDQIPSLSLKTKNQDGIQDIPLNDLCHGKSVILIGVPGAYTPTCSSQHLPGFLANHHHFKNKGVDEIACISVNDPFVMEAWGKSCNIADNEIQMLADHKGELTKALGLEVDMDAAGLGTRSQRYAMLVKDGKVEQLYVESPADLDKSSAEYLLERM